MDFAQAHQAFEQHAHDLDARGRAAFLLTWAMEVAGTGRGTLAAADARQHAGHGGQAYELLSHLGDTHAPAPAAAPPPDAAMLAAPRARRGG